MYICNVIHNNLKYKEIYRQSNQYIQTHYKNDNT